MKTKIPVLLIAVSLLCFQLLPGVRAVVPPPDGGYPGFNTAEGTKALQNLTTGAANTAAGWYSLFTTNSGSYNTGVGAATLALNEADQNTAIGAAALLLNTTGSGNTANGALALLFNTTGSNNTATGSNALSNNTGDDNTAAGESALHANTTGIGNTAIGRVALRGNTTGFGNTATGGGALLLNTDGARNTALGFRALWVSSGDGNTAIGHDAGIDLTTGDGNVCIGDGVGGAIGASNTTWIRNVYSSVATARQVYVDADNKIGTLSSSRRYKEQIAPMENASEMLFALKPVTFRYKKHVDPGQSLSFGLIAEEVARISPELVTLDPEGKPQTVRYEAVNAMLLNEFLKEHQKMQEQGAQIAELKKEIAGLVATVKEQAAQIQKVNTQLELKNSTQLTANEL
jgi:endosialidase-like protein